MTAQKPPAEDRVEEMRKLQEGVDAANQKLARVTRYLGAATQALKDATRDRGPVQAAEAPPKDEPEVT